MLTLVTTLTLLSTPTLAQEAPPLTAAACSCPVTCLSLFRPEDHAPPSPRAGSPSVMRRTPAAPAKITFKAPVRDLATHTPAHRGQVFETPSSAVETAATVKAPTFRKTTVAGPLRAAVNRMPVRRAAPKRNARR